MAQTQRIVESLKTALKAQGVSYRRVAEHLGVSESSVKRLFSRGGFTLERVESICNLLGIDLMELARQAEESRHQVASLTEDQEREVVDDPELMLVAICALNRWRFKDIVHTYRIAPTRLVRLLARLDRLGLLELMPGNRIKLRITRNFTWLPNGPIHQYFVRHLQDEFLSAKFVRERDVHRFAWGMLSPDSAAALREKILELLETFNERSRGDELRPRFTRTGTCLLVAFREWEPKRFESMRR